MTFDVYCNNMRKDKTFGGFAEIRAISQVYKRCIVVFHKTGNIYSKTVISEGRGNPLHIFYNGDSHFDSLVETKD